MTTPTPEQRRAWKERAKQRKAETREFVPTKEQRDKVSALVFLGTSEEMIARIISDAGTLERPAPNAPQTPLTLDELRRKFRQELRFGAEEVKAKLGMLVMQKALTGDKGALGVVSRAVFGGQKGDDRDESRGNRGRAEGDSNGAEPGKLDFSKITTSDLLAVLKADRETSLH